MEKAKQRDKTTCSFSITSRFKVKQSCTDRKNWQRKKKKDKRRHHSLPPYTKKQSIQDDFFVDLSTTDPEQRKDDFFFEYKHHATPPKPPSSPKKNVNVLTIIGTPQLPPKHQHKQQPLYRSASTPLVRAQDDCFITQDKNSLNFSFSPCSSSSYTKTTPTFPFDPSCSSGLDHDMMTNKAQTNMKPVAITTTQDDFFLNMTNSFNVDAELFQVGSGGDLVQEEEKKEMNVASFETQFQQSFWRNPNYVPLTTQDDSFVNCVVKRQHDVKSVDDSKLIFHNQSAFPYFNREETPSETNYPNYVPLTISSTQPIAFQPSPQVQQVETDSILDDFLLNDVGDLQVDSGTTIESLSTGLTPTIAEECSMSRDNNSLVFPGSNFDGTSLLPSLEIRDDSYLDLLINSNDSDPEMGNQNTRRRSQSTI